MFDPKSEPQKKVLLVSFLAAAGILQTISSQFYCRRVLPSNLLNHPRVLCSFFRPLRRGDLYYYFHFVCILTIADIQTYFKYKQSVTTTHDPGITIRYLIFLQKKFDYHNSI